MVPQHQGEIAQFREQVGPAMVLLGLEARAPHAVLLLDGLAVIDVAHGINWNDRGVLVRPFVHMSSPHGDEWIVEGLRYGVTIACERVGAAPLDIPVTESAIELAQQLRVAVDRVRFRAIGE